MNIKCRVKKLERESGMKANGVPDIIWVHVGRADPDDPESDYADLAFIVGRGPPHLDCRRREGEAGDAFMERISAAVDHLDKTGECSSEEAIR